MKTTEAEIMQHGTDLGWRYNMRQDLPWLAGLSIVAGGVLGAAFTFVPGLRDHNPLNMVMEINSMTSAQASSYGTLTQFAASGIFHAVLFNGLDGLAYLSPAVRRNQEISRLNCWVALRDHLENDPFFSESFEDEVIMSDIEQGK